MRKARTPTLRRHYGATTSHLLLFSDLECKVRTKTPTLICFVAPILETFIARITNFVNANLSCTFNSEPPKISKNNSFDKKMSKPEAQLTALKTMLHYIPVLWTRIRWLIVPQPNCDRPMNLPDGGSAQSVLKNTR